MFVKVNGIELYYEVVGNGRPLIMLHGNREDHSIFEKAAERLKEYHTIYLPDSRCHGLSGNPEKLTYNLISDDVIAFIEALKIEKPLLLGYSDGAIAALYVAAKRSDLLSGVIAAGANSHPKGLKRYVYRGLKLKVLFARDKYDYLMLNGPNLKKSDFKIFTIQKLVREFFYAYDTLSNFFKSVLLKNKDTNECYVIDNWIDPEGGLFKKEDWETMIQSVYQSDKINVSLEKM